MRSSFEKSSAVAEMAAQCCIYATQIIKRRGGSVFGRVCSHKSVMPKSRIIRLHFIADTMGQLATYALAEMTRCISHTRIKAIQGHHF